MKEAESTITKRFRTDVALGRRALSKYECLLRSAKAYPAMNLSALEVYFGVLRVSAEIITANERYFAQNGISQGRAIVLCLLNRNRDVPICPAELALRAGVSRATMTGLLHGLEHDGLIKRAREIPSDKRKYFVELTAKGKQCIDTVLRDWLRRIGAFISGISVRDRAVLQRSLSKVHCRLKVLASDRLTPET